MSLSIAKAFVDMERRQEASRVKDQQHTQKGPCWHRGVYSTFHGEGQLKDFGGNPYVFAPQMYRIVDRIINGRQNYIPLPKVHSKARKTLDLRTTIYPKCR